VFSTHGSQTACGLPTFFALIAKLYKSLAELSSMSVIFLSTPMYLNMATTNKKRKVEEEIFFKKRGLLSTSL
jgi:hypothetical protein